MTRLGQPTTYDRCGFCGKSIRPRNHFHRCSDCGAEMRRANLSSVWHTSRLGSIAAENVKELHSMQ